MKHKYLYLTLLITLITTSINAQVIADSLSISVDPSYELDKDYFNRWTVEIDAGMTKGAKPYNTSNKFFASDPSKFFGGFQVNHFGLGARYMVNSKFGFKTHLSYDIFKNLKGSESLDFRVEAVQLTFEGAVNAVRLFDVQEELKRFGIIFHSGLQFARVSPKMGYTSGHHEWNGGVTVGVTPEYRIINNLSLFLDFTVNSNVRQHFNWDGSYAEEQKNLTGSFYTTALGLTYSFGKQKIHGDWAIIRDSRLKEIDELNDKIGQIEDLMTDSDKDGVPDYLDVENNSIPGVAVDTKGRMVDKNNNGVPDELEKYVDNSIVNNNTNINSIAADSAVIQLINDGYIAAYFDLDVRQPTNASSDNLGFILNYLRVHPEKSIDIVGYADELGFNEYNMALSIDRAKNVKDIFIKAGINASRMNVKGEGIDTTVDKNSEEARRLVRKVVFRIK